MALDNGPTDLAISRPARFTCYRREISENFLGRLPTLTIYWAGVFGDTMPPSHPRPFRDRHGNRPIERTFSIDTRIVSLPSAGC